jgi:hypothetical protein
MSRENEFRRRGRKKVWQRECGLRHADKGKETEVGKAEEKKEKSERLAGGGVGGGGEACE